MSARGVCRGPYETRSYRVAGTCVMISMRDAGNRKGMVELRHMGRALTAVLAVLTLLCLLLGAAVVTFKLTGLKFCTVDGHSMDDTLFDGERLILNPSAEPRFGDVVVFDYGGSYLVKRVIGLPGDTVMVANGVLYVNNVRYSEPYLSEVNTQEFRKSTFSVKVGEDEYFVMGDNRDNSRDGRSFGCIPGEALTGVAIWHF